jgi:hypothetical protein
LGVDEIAEHEVDNAVAAAERYRRLGSLFRQRKQTGSLAASEDDRENLRRSGHFRFLG